MPTSTQPLTRTPKRKVTDSPAVFIALLKSGVSHITEAALMLKRLVDRDKNVIEEIRALEPTLAPSVLTKLLLVAEGHLMPELLLNNAPAFKHLQSLPVAVQQEAIRRGTVEVVVSAESGEHRPVPLAEVEPRQIPQVFDKAGLRSIDGQREYLKRTPRHQVPVAKVELPWVIKGGNCLITRLCMLTKKDFARIIPCVFTKQELLRIADTLS